MKNWKRNTKNINREEMELFIIPSYTLLPEACSLLGFSDDKTWGSEDGVGRIRGSLLEKYRPVCWRNWA